MEYFILFFLVALIFGMKFLIEFLNDKDRRISLDSLPYIKKKYFLTDTERKFYLELCDWFQDQYYIFPQVHISDIIDIIQEHKKYHTHLNKIDRKSVDFVLFDKIDMLPVLVVELDDYTHTFSHRRERDRFVDAVFEKTEIPIIHIQNINQNNREIIIAHIENKIKAQSI